MRSMYALRILLNFPLYLIAFLSPTFLPLPPIVLSNPEPAYNAGCGLMCNVQDVADDGGCDGFHHSELSVQSTVSTSDEQDESNTTNW